LTAERQLGLIWGAVALLLVLVTPLASGLASALPPCPIRTLFDLPCPSCGTTRAALGLVHLDLGAALASSPLATLAWVMLVGGGLLAGLLAVFGKPLAEPEWLQSSSFRWLLVAAVLGNWLYLLGVGA
jgi:hypothetical protein